MKNDEIFEVGNKVDIILQNNIQEENTTMIFEKFKEFVNKLPIITGGIGLPEFEIKTQLNEVELRLDPRRHTYYIIGKGVII
jgi:DNA polymerase III delta prime subunit